MDEFISREAAIEKFMQYTWYDEDGSPIDDSDKKRDILEDMFSDIPAADVRPVVYCVECEYWNRDHVSCEGLARCLTGETGVRYRNERDFCSRGAKMGGTQ